MIIDQDRNIWDNHENNRYKGEKYNLEGNEYEKKKVIILGAIVLVIGVILGFVI